MWYCQICGCDLINEQEFILSIHISNIEAKVSNKKCKEIKFLASLEKNVTNVKAHIRRTYPKACSVCILRYSIKSQKKRQNGNDEKTSR